MEDASLNAKERKISTQNTLLDPSNMVIRTENSNSKERLLYSSTLSHEKDQTPSDGYGRSQKVGHFELKPHLRNDLDILNQQRYHRFSESNADTLNFSYAGYDKYKQSQLNSTI